MPRTARRPRNAATLRSARIALVLGLACSTPLAAFGAKLQVAADAPPLPAIAGSRLVLLAPEVQFEDERSGEPLDPARFKGSELAARVDRVVRATLTARGLAADAVEVAGAASYPPPAKLVRRELPADACTNSAAATSGEPLLAVHVRVIVGSRGSWDPMTGAITSSSNRTRLRAALVDCRASTTLWRSEVVLRQIPEPGRADIDRALETLFGRVSE